MVDAPEGADPPGLVLRPLLARTFDADQITGLRHAVAECAKASGLSGHALDDFVLAVNELATNAVRHGGGQGRLRLWRADDRLVCEVADHGAGIPPGGANGSRRPTPETVGGWGLWLARQLTDSMVLQTGPEGTRVRISAPTAPA